MIDGLKPYPKYKDSGVPWLGEVPEHWEVARVKSVLFERVEKGFPGEPLLAATQSMGVVRKTEYESRTVVATKDLQLLKLVHKSDFVISLRSFQGGIEFARHRGIISPAYTVLACRRSGYHAYLAALFKSQPFIGSLRLFVTGIRQGQNIDYSGLSRSRIPLPSREEREAITRFLRHLNSLLKRYIRAKKKLIALLNEQKQAIIHRAVTRGFDPNVPLKPSGLAWLGHIPERWEIKRAKDLCSAIVDCKNRTPEQVDDGRYLVVRTSCVRHGRFDPSGGYPTDEKNFSAWTARGAPQSGDVFFTREAPAGEACLVPHRADLCMGQRMMYFRPDPELLDPRFLLLSIYGPVARNYIDVLTNGSTVGHLRVGHVHGMPVLWCPITEQREIANVVERQGHSIDQAVARANYEISLSGELRKRLIADVVTGKLDVRQAAAHLPLVGEADEFPEIGDTDEETANDPEIEALEIQE